MEKPVISVVSPIYKTDLSLVQCAYESLLKQTIGFENIEWIIIVHNSGQEYYRSVCGLFAMHEDGGSAHENIHIEQLENEGRGPSSPRNLGISRASAPYIAFLDADDTFTEKCLETAVRHAEKNNADITVFRRSYEQESENLARVTEVVRWNQMREEIVLTRNTWDEEKMFVGVWGMVTSRIYKRLFLVDNDIRFRDEVPFGEDFMFNVEAYHYADTICYLPQLIGYRYFINASSMVQGEKKTADTLVSYAKGYRILFETALKYGIYMNPTISRLCCVLSKFIIGCEDMTPEKLSEIRELLGEYIEMTTPMAPDKIYPEDAVREAYELPRQVILDSGTGVSLKDEDMLYASDRYIKNIPEDRVLLRKILTKNESTDIGKYYRFSNIMTLTAFKERLPLTSYDDYEPMIRLQTEIGESGILTSEPVKAYVLTAGSMGVSKCIPIIADSLRRFSADTIKNTEGEDYFVIADMYVSGQRFNDDTIEGSPFGLAITETIRIQRKIDMSGVLFDIRKRGVDRGSFLYIQLLYALIKPEYTMILGPNTRDIYDAFCLLEIYHEEICRDIEEGKLRGVGKLIFTKEMIEFTAKYTRPRPERAKELREIFAGGFDEPVIKKLWPSLKSILACGDGHNRIYTHNLKKYIGDIPVFEIGYLRPETFVGSSGRDGLYRLDIKNTYFEFLPFDHGVEGETTLSIHELKKGQAYQPILTTKSGFYRLRTSDVMVYMGEEKGVPLVTYEYDSTQSFYAGELYLTEKDISLAVIDIIEKLDIRVDDFAYLWDEDKEVIDLYIELYDESDANGTAASRMEEIFRRYLQSCISSDGRGGDVPKVAVYLVEPQTHQLYTDIQAFRYGYSSIQVRPVRYLDNPVKEGFFKAHIMN